MQAVGGQVEVGKASVRCFAECFIPPNVVNQPAFRNLIKTVQAYPRAGLPDRHSLLRDHGHNGPYLAAVLADVVSERTTVVSDTYRQGAAGNLLTEGAKSTK